MKTLKDFTGQLFGEYTVLRRVANRGGKAHLECRCNCGEVRIVDAWNLRSGHIQSCGCRAARHCAVLGRASKTHGHSKVSGQPSRTYRTWQSMLQRCHNPKMIHFVRYGGRGISVTKPWRDSFESFLNDMGERPIGRTLDRIDNRFGYFYANCRWATPKQQANNRQKPGQC